MHMLWAKSFHVLKHKEKEKVKVTELQFYFWKMLH